MRASPPHAGVPAGHGALVMIASSDMQFDALCRGYGALTPLSVGAADDLFDSGATHWVHPSDAGAIEGSWRPDVEGLVLGDKNILPAFGSVEKCFIMPDGGPDITRRVLIAPGVCSRVWSASAEVDLHKSTVVDSPKSKHITLLDGRVIPIRRAPNGLRRIDLHVRLASPSCAVMVAGGIATLGALAATTASILGSLCSLQPNRITVGVGKPSVLLSGLETLWLWHHRLGHPSMRALLAHLRAAGLWDLCSITRSDVRAFARESCDFCNAFKQRRKAKLRVRWDADVPRHDGPTHIPSITRALRPLVRVLIDIFGPVRWPSAQHEYIYLIGWWCQATGMRWVQGTKSHTAQDIEEWNQRMRAALRFTVGEIEIIRTDGSTEFGRSHAWPAYLSDSLIAREQSNAYDARQMGGIERVWGVCTPDARCMLHAASMGKRHWYTAFRHAVFLACVQIGDAVRLVDGTVRRCSAFWRAYGAEYPSRALRTYGAPVRYVLDEKQRDDKFDETARAGHYVGISPDNATSHWLFDGHKHVTVGGSCVVDETRFITNAHAPAERIPTWPAPDNDSTHDETDTPPIARAGEHTPPPAQLNRAVLTLPKGTRLEFRAISDDAASLRWVPGTVVSTDVSATGRRQHQVRWDNGHRWNGDAVTHMDLLDGRVLWRVSSRDAPSQPAAQPARDLISSRTRAHGPASLHVGAARVPERASVAAALMRLKAEVSVPDEPFILYLCSGARRPGDFASAVAQRSGCRLHVVNIDTVLDPDAHDLANHRVARYLARIATSQLCVAVLATPPCRTFSAALLARPTAPAARTHAEPKGVRNGAGALPPKVEHDNLVVAHVLLIVEAAWAHGAPFIIENPVPRDAASPHAIPGREEHVSLWHYPAIIAFIKRTNAQHVDFDQCQLGAATQKTTWLLCSAR